MTVAVAPEARAAQQRIVSTINASGRLNADGLALWREVNCGEWKATAADISRDLDLLQVPHTIVTDFRFPLATSYRKAVREGEEVRILRKDLAHLVPWMPSLEQTVADIPEDAPHWDFTVVQPRTDGMVIAKLALSAEWLSWSKKQARAARLVCAECDYDLRDKDETRAPFDVRLPDQPKRRRLVCGQRCNDGVDELERCPHSPDSRCDDRRGGDGQAAGCGTGGAAQRRRALQRPQQLHPGRAGLRTGGTGTFSAFTSEGTRRNRAVWYWIATRPLVVRHGEPAGAAQVEHAEGSAGSHQRTVGGGQDSLA
jgi:hypothetical protein